MSTEPSSCTVTVEKAIFDIDCTQRAAAALSGVASFNFRDLPNTLEITISVRTPSTLTGHEVRDRFLNEILDQQLRQRIAAETKTERDLVLAYAFSNTKLVG